VPRTISDKELGEIDKLPTKAAACELALDLNANIELLEFKTEVAARAEKLEYFGPGEPGSALPPRYVE